MEISLFLFHFRPQSWSPRAYSFFKIVPKTQRGTPENGTSTDLRRGPWDFNLSSRIDEVVLHINPTCGVEAELGIQTGTETVLDWTYPKYRTAQRATLHSKSSANIAKDNNTCSILFIQLKLHWTRHIGRIELHNEPHYILKVLQILPRITIPVQSCSSNWNCTGLDILEE